ncbi:MAG: hypothetical protein HKN91_12895 [Acidimicrobiia bacterium]|nr:hypothetical protein [Acidimicrobiia bacterium]
MPRLLIIANPAASGFTGAALRSVTRVLSRNYDVDTDWPTSAEGSRQAAAAAAEAGYDVVAAMGGDGVAHQVANGLVHSETALALLPAGTTNVLARIIGQPTKPAKAAAAINAGTARSMTLAHVTDGDRSDHALFALGVGFDADMVRESEKRPLSKGKIGSLHYVRSAISVAIRDYRAKPANLIATCDGESFHAVTVLVQIHNIYTYFGPVAFTLSPDVSEGPIAMATRELPVHKAIAIAGTAALQRNLEMRDGVRLWPGFQKLIIEADPSARMQADGDLLGVGEYFEITPAPDALRMVLPS